MSHQPSTASTIEAPPAPPPRDPKKPKPKPKPEFLTPAQVAKMGKVHISTCYRWCLDGKLAARKVAGRKFLIRREDAEEFLAGVPVVPRKHIPWSRFTDGADAPRKPA